MIRRWFVAGLLVWLPLAATFLVLQLLVGFLDRSLLLLPQGWRPEALLGFEIPGLGILLSLLLVLVTGFLAANLIGRRLLGMGEALLGRIPLIRSIYSGVKRLTEMVLDDSGSSFRKVLLVEYPRRECWTLAFQTGVPSGEIQARTERELLTVFVPTTPNPTSGFVLLVPKAEVIELEMSVEDGMRMVISLGALGPDRVRREDAHQEPAAGAVTRD